MPSLLKEFWNKFQSQSKYSRSDEQQSWAIKGLRLTVRDDQHTSTSMFLELRAFVVIALIPALYIFAAETSNQWFYILDAGLVSAMLLGFVMPLLQVLDVSTTSSIPSSAVNGESVLVKVSLARKWRFNWFSKLIPIRWLLVRTNLLSHLGHSSVVKPMVIEQVENDAWVYAATAPLHRGVYRLESVELYSCFPFGLAWWCRKFESNRNLLEPDYHSPKPMITVYPPGVLVEGAFLYKVRAGTDSPMGLQTHRRPTNATSSLVRSVRDFRHGDSPRLVHWASSARCGRLLVREFESEGLPGFDLLLNLTWDWRSQDQFELAVSVTYSLLQLGFRLGGAPELYLIPNLDLDGVYLPTFMQDLPALPSGLSRSSHLLARVVPFKEAAINQPVDLVEQAAQALLTIRPAAAFEPDKLRDDPSLYEKVELAVIPRVHENAPADQPIPEVHMPVHEFGIMNRRTGRKISGRVLSVIEKLEDIQTL